MARSEDSGISPNPEDGEPMRHSPQDPRLPQNDPDPQQRQNYLRKNREAYVFDTEYLSPLPLLKDLPKEEDLLKNDPFDALQFFRRRVESESYKFILKLAAKVHSFIDPFDNIQDYEDLFTALPLSDSSHAGYELFELLDKPKVIKTYQNDNAFAEQRLSGANPAVVRRLRGSEELPISFSEKLDELQKLYGISLNLSEELAKGNLYLTDYTVLPAIKGGEFKEEGQTKKKFLPRPMALFSWRSDRNGEQGGLEPVAIQLEVPTGALFTPFDQPTDWFLAKLYVQIADGNHHEMITHLGRTHFVMEPIAVVTARQLAPNHPLSMLLRPHFRYMLGLNSRGRDKLINKDGPVDHLMAGTLAESLQLLTEDYKTYWSFDQFAFPIEIKNRGMADTEATPHYPYRDDGMLVWEAIEKYVGKYLQIYYKTPEDICQDKELQAWAQEMVSESGAKVKGFPASFQDLNSLIQVVTNIIFTCGPLHAAINTPQYEYMAFVPNMPLAAYQPVPQKGHSQKELLQFLPPQGQAIEQLGMIRTLSAYKVDQLGYYKKEDFTDPEALAVIQQFQQNLNYVEAKIDEKNRSRTVPYPFFKPSQLLNSISI
jgi:arachidonate 15-lipoxygenase